MLEKISISNEEILHQLRLSCKIQETAKEIISRKVIEEAATSAVIKVETKELQEAADKFRFLNQLRSADETWSWLEKNGLSLDDFEELVYHTVISGKLANHLFADKVEPYFYERQLDYAGAVIYEVILEDEDIAIELFYAIKEGEMSFYDAVHEYTQDKELRRSGGYRGLLPRKKIKSEISAAIFAASPPQLLKPIVTSTGVHLIFVEEIIKPELDNKLRFQIATDLFSTWLSQKIDAVEIIS
jgi:parvulin-like peptidyl-prolyl isomerase